MNLFNLISLTKLMMSKRRWHTTIGLGDVAVFENRLPVTAAKCLDKSSLLILLPGVICRLELMPINEPIAENIFVTQPYCQTACCTPFYFFGAMVAELKRTSLSQSIEPLSMQKVSANSFVNLFIICEYD